MNMVITPKEFQKRMWFQYPPNNIELFEEYFLDRFISVDEWTYLPILWTPMICHRDIKGNYDDVQAFLNELDRSKRYFTICQHDDNILNDLSHLNITILAAGGYGRYRKRVYPLPLICSSKSDPSQVYPKTIFASFVGAIDAEGVRHPIRVKMRDALKGNSKYIIKEAKMNNMSYPHFIQTMRNSTFSLCPRGYGQTSYRICEALQNDSIPVYIYDDPMIPFFDVLDFETYGILIHERDIPMLDEVLSSKTPEDIENYRQNGKKVYQQYFSYRGCYNSILLYLSQ